MGASCAECNTKVILDEPEGNANLSVYVHATRVICPGERLGESERVGDFLITMGSSPYLFDKIVF
jgi:hypothetical protein